jgi:hypothetical protein
MATSIKLKPEGDGGDSRTKGSQITNLPLIVSQNRAIGNRESEAARFPPKSLEANERSMPGSLHNPARHPGGPLPWAELRVRISPSAPDGTHEIRLAHTVVAPTGAAGVAIDPGPGVDVDLVWTDVPDWARVG